MSDMFSKIFGKIKDRPSNHFRNAMESDGVSSRHVNGVLAIFYPETFRRLKSATDPALPRLLDTKSEEFIGSGFVNLPESSFWDQNDLTKYDGKSGNDFLIAATAIVDCEEDQRTEIVRIGYREDDTGTLCAFSEKDLCIGIYEGPSLKVDPVWRGRGIGKFLVAVKALEAGGANPQGECDEIGYTPAGLAATIAGFEIAKDIARQFSTIAPDLFERPTPRPRMG